MINNLALHCVARIRYRVGLRLFLVLLSISFLLSCDKSPAGNELQRKTSPDQRVDAVLVSKAVDATVATTLELYVVAHGQSWSGASPLLRGDKFEGVDLIWRGRRLDIPYKKGRIFLFTNFWNSAAVENFKYVVEVRLLPESDSTIE
jgi:hypothetical protein